MAWKNEKNEFEGPHLQPTFFTPSELKKQRIKNIKLIEFDQKFAENKARDKKNLTRSVSKSKQWPWWPRSHGDRALIIPSNRIDVEFPVVGKYYDF